MDILKKYGSQAAIGLVSAGLICLVLAFFVFPQIVTARIWSSGEEQPAIIKPDNRFPANWLQKLGIRLYPGDSLSYSGIEVPLTFAIPESGALEIAYQPGIPITLIMDGSVIEFSSSAESIGEALWEYDILLKEGDKLTLSAAKPLDQPTTIELRTGKPVSIVNKDLEIEVFSAAETVGGALVEAGIDLQGLDFARPAEDEALPSDRRIEIVRVSEETIMETEVIPYTLERVPDSEMAIGESKILQTGQNGVITSSVRVRIENGEEVSREILGEWISKQPISQKTAYGTQVVVQTSPEGLNYWLTKSVRITSYRDTGNPTASGIWPYYGVIAVSPEWYSILKGTSIYVPGYGVGTVLDVCPGCSGEPWIDVFIPTEDYVSWSRTETVYFLAPVPDNFSGDLP